MLRPLVKAALPLAMQPFDDEVGRVVGSTDDLRSKFEGKRVLAVGGTKGIGKAIVTCLSTLGADVVSVGRTAAPPTGVAADLSTIAGCQDLVAKLTEDSRPFAFAVFTVGAWPNPTKPLTSDGVDNVVALDLVVRHYITTRLASEGMLEEGCRVMSVLAAGQRLPPSLINADLVRERLEASAPDSAGESPPERGRTNGFLNMLSTAVAHDAWIQHMSEVRPKLVFMSTFPGLLASDLPFSSGTLPACLAPVFKLAMLPVGDSEEIMGLNHVRILASPNATVRRVTYWAAPLLQACKAHPVAYDATLAAFICKWLESLINQVQRHNREQCASAE